MIAGGVVLAVPMAWAAFAAWFSYYPLGGSAWDDVAGAWCLLSLAAVMVLHLLWIATWFVWTAAGPARFLAVVLLLPATLWSASEFAHNGWEQSAGAGRGRKGWPSVSELLATPSGPLVDHDFLAVVVPAAAVAIAVLAMIRVRRRSRGEIVRIIAVGAALLGSLGLAWMFVLVAGGLLFDV